MVTKNSIIYQIVTDRFNNNSNDLWKSADSVDYNDRFGSFIGGTFKGIKNKIDYLLQLGVNQLLLSPCAESESYHGYDVVDSYKVNSHFGTREDLENLITTCHNNGIKVMMDYAPTHISSRHPLFIEKMYGNSSDKLFFMFKNEMRESDYQSYYDEIIFKLTSGNISNLDSVNNSRDYLGYFGLENLPLLNLENPEVIEFHKHVLNYWFENFGFDDLRLDSGFLQPRNFIKEMQNFLSFSHPGTDIIVEYWDFMISSGENFESSRFYCTGFANGEFDIGGSLEFNFRYNQENFFKRIMDNYFHFRDISKDYKTVLSISNHDLPRFSGSKNLQKILATLQFTLPAIPLIYYGEEIGMQQCNDQRDRIAQSRDVMRFDHYDPDMFSFYQKLIEFRKKHLFGDVDLSEVQINDSGSLLSYKIKLGEDSYLVFLNKENREKPVDTGHLFHNPDVDPFDYFGGLMKIENGLLTVKPESSHIVYLLSKNLNI